MSDEAYTKVLITIIVLLAFAAAVTFVYDYADWLNGVGNAG